MEQHASNSLNVDDAADIADYPPEDYDYRYTWESRSSMAEGQWDLIKKHRTYTDSRDSFALKVQQHTPTRDQPPTQPVPSAAIMAPPVQQTSDGAPLASITSVEGLLECLKTQNSTLHAKLLSEMAADAAQ